MGLCIIDTCLAVKLVYRFQVLQNTFHMSAIGNKAITLSTMLSHFGLDSSQSHIPRSRHESGTKLFPQSKSILGVPPTGPGAVVKMLLLSGPDLGAPDQRFNLPLRMVAVAGDVEFLRLLVEGGVEVNSSRHYYRCAPKQRLVLVIWNV